MSHLLFQTFSYELELPTPFNVPEVKTVRDDARSKYSPSSSSSSTLHAPTLTALKELIYAYNSLPQAAKIAVGIKGGGQQFMVEREIDGTTEVVVYNALGGDFYAGIAVGESKDLSSYSVKKKGQDGTALFLALLAAHSYKDSEPGMRYKDEEYNSISRNLEDTLLQLENHSYNDEERTLESLSFQGAVLCDNVYRRVQLEPSHPASVPAIILETKTVPRPQPRALKTGVFEPDNIICGEFKILGGTKEKSSVAAVQNNKEFEGMIAFGQREFTPEEKLLIPTIPDWFIVPEVVVDICQHAKATSSSNMPMRNFMLRGPAGGGKTESARAIAAAFGLPFVIQTCSANSEIFDFLGGFLPDAEGSNETTGHAPDIPSMQDIKMDPATAYHKLTGEYNDDVTDDDVYKKLVEVLSRSASSEKGSQGLKYMKVEPPLVKAMKYGWCLELQEPSVIANPGVLVGLNSLLDNCQQITLPTGEIINRHPDTVIVITTNNDYAGCRNMNQSVISRMNLLFDIEEPSEDVLVKRITAITGFKDEDEIKLMASVVKDIQKRCSNNFITDGSCGVRELIAWVQSYMVTNDMYKSALYTVLSSATADPESRADILSTCIEPKVAS